MSAIFKKRKTPKHLIIRDEYATRSRNRFTLLKGLVWLGLLVLLTWVGLSMVQYTASMS